MVVGKTLCHQTIFLPLDLSIGRHWAINQDMCLPIGGKHKIQNCGPVSRHKALPPYGLAKTGKDIIQRLLRWCWLHMEAEVPLTFFRGETEETSVVRNDGGKDVAFVVGPRQVGPKALYCVQDFSPWKTRPVARYNRSQDTIIPAKQFIPHVLKKIKKMPRVSTYNPQTRLFLYLVVS